MTYPLLVIALVGCVTANPSALNRAFHQAEKVILSANQNNATACAPVVLAKAEVALHQAKILLARGELTEGGKLIRTANTLGGKASVRAISCTKEDQDQDGIIDILDLCPDSKEDMDGDKDTDGCYDADPYADDDNDGVINIDDACPTEKEDIDGDQDDDGCPEEAVDTDGDGLFDSEDECPNEAEDKDRFQDSDGCPDLDNDADGVLDFKDECPRTPEDTDNFEDEDGCPEYDNDQDDVPDLLDRCPFEPGVPERDGCPI
jgi:hypothetical protein